MIIVIMSEADIRMVGQYAAIDLKKVWCRRTFFLFDAGDVQLVALRHGPRRNGERIFGEPRVVQQYRIVRGRKIVVSIKHMLGM